MRRTVCTLGAALAMLGIARAADAPADDMSDLFARYAVRPADVPDDLVAAAQKQFDCSLETIRSGIVGIQISEEAAIWDVPCRRAAGNVSHVLASMYIFTPPEFQEFIALPAAPGRKRDKPPVILNPVWDMKARTVTSFARGRAQGDCGTYEVFKGGDLALVELREKADCDGKVVPPTQFPLVFPKPR